ncbi:hypothetical protein B4100_2333 [Heyndrickxia coagulans]|nr:hypothetical protein B4100_2333 [Heyndrickxia coagulans]
MILTRKERVPVVGGRTYLLNHQFIKFLFTSVQNLYKKMEAITNVPFSLIDVFGKIKLLIEE